MYLYHFGLRKLPFSLTPDTELFCSLNGYKEALNTIQFALTTGEAFCHVSGEVGTGKTMLCRWVMNHIDDQRMVAYLPNPILTPKELKLALATELSIRVNKNTSEEQLIPKIQKKLIEINKVKGPVVLIIDEAQTMPDETLEALRLFTNLETETTKLLQIILFSQPELDRKLQQDHLRQLRQRIAFRYQLPSLSRRQIKLYLSHRLNRVAAKQRHFFSSSAYSVIAWASRGIPRLANIIAHKSLMVAFGRNHTHANVLDVLSAMSDTPDTSARLKLYQRIAFAFTFLAFSSSALAYWVLG
ncbi:MAG: ExeA family protein [Gammaproteobacteria bacterium]|nr:ExeA family protein [Gammaproteobacteria bacterium]NVK87292.1 ExeA family protein [Gammaproteobacteria bacterium]